MNADQREPTDKKVPINSKFKTIQISERKAFESGANKKDTVHLDIFICMNGDRDTMQLRITSKPSLRIWKKNQFSQLQYSYIHNSSY